MSCVLLSDSQHTAKARCLSTSPLQIGHESCGQHSFHSRLGIDHRHLNTNYKRTITHSHSTPALLTVSGRVLAEEACGERERGVGMRQRVEPMVGDPLIPGQHIAAAVQCPVPKQAGESARGRVTGEKEGCLSRQKNADSKVRQALIGWERSQNTVSVAVAVTRRRTMVHRGFFVQSLVETHYIPYLMSSSPR